MPLGEPYLHFSSRSYENNGHDCFRFSNAHEHYDFEGLAWIATAGCESSNIVGKWHRVPSKSYGFHCEHYLLRLVVFQVTRTYLSSELLKNLFKHRILENSRDSHIFLLSMLQDHIRADLSQQSSLTFMSVLWKTSKKAQMMVNDEISRGRWRKFLIAWMWPFITLFMAWWCIKEIIGSCLMCTWRPAYTCFLSFTCISINHRVDSRFNIYKLSLVYFVQSI